MSKVNNLNSINFVNHGCQFVVGLVLNHDAGESFDVEVKASHSRFPTKWITPSANIIFHDDRIVIEFQRPVNYFNFQIDVYGSEISMVNGFFLEYKPKSREDIIEYIKEKTITFAAPVRNCGTSLVADVNLAIKIGEFFKNYNIVIFENDSIDETKRILQDFHGHERIKVITMDNLDQKFPFRTQRISFARNKLFNEVKKIGSDYFCTMDMDGVIGLDFDIEGFLSNFYYDDCWDAVFPVNVDKYYDIWTLRHPDICPGDYERDMNSMDPIFSDEIIFDNCLNNLQRMDFKKLNGWLNVMSAFGGMGIYKTSKFVNSSYFGVKDNYEVSDHVAFHLKAVESGAMLYLNPRFLVNSKLGL